MAVHCAAERIAAVASFCVPPADRQTEACIQPVSYTHLQYPTETAADIQTNHAAEIAAAQQQIAAQFGNTITTAMGGAVDNLAQGVANAAKRAALETAGEMCIRDSI